MAQKIKPKDYGNTKSSPISKAAILSRISNDPIKLGKIQSVWQLSRAVIELLKSNKKLFFGITIVYGLLGLILVQSLAKSSDIVGIKDELSQSITGSFGVITASLSLFANLAGSSTSNTISGSSAYQLFLGIITTLATIWAVRQVLTGSKPRIRDSFYKGMYPLVPFVIVVLIIGLQLLPLVVGATIYSVVIYNGIAVIALEKFLWGLLFALLSLVSLLLISASTFALYIVTLPDMTPMKALKSANKLVKGRKSTVVRKLLFLPLALMVLGSLVMLPVIFWLTALTPWVFYILSSFTLVVVNIYIYILYRDLLNE